MVIRLPLMLLLLALLAGCATTTPPSSFYILHSLYSAPGTEPFSPSPDGMVVGFGPLVMPDYLDRPQIVTREDVNQLVIDEFHRWGGELSSGLKRVMAQDLSFLLNSDRVQVYPWPSRMKVEYQVRFALIRLDGALGKQAVVRARWEILLGEDGREVASDLVSLVEPVEGPGYRELVAAQSRALASVAADISDKLKQLGPPK